MITGMVMLMLGACGSRGPRVMDSGERLLRLRAGAEVERLRLGHLRVRVAARKKRLQKLGQIYGVARGVQQVRGLRLRRSLDVSDVDRAFVRRFVKRSILRDYGPDHVEGYTATLARLGMLPRGYDWVTSLQDLLGEQGAGFYDPHSKKLYLRGDMPATEIILAHEIAHAIQDQHFDIVRMQGDNKDNDDRSFAVSALVEGDATLTMVLYLRETLSWIKAARLLGSMVEMLSMDQQKIESAPLYIRESLIGTYIKGLAFAQALKKIGGEALLNRAFRNLPVSSEQILHPAKYLRGEQPLPVKLPDLLPLLGRGWKQLHENTLGEFGFQVLLRGSLASRMSAEVAAAGWGGDRLRSYRHKSGKELLVWRLLWDKDKDAVQAREALARYLGARHGFSAGKKGRGAGGAWLRSWAARDHTVQLWGKGREVLLLDLPAGIDVTGLRRALGM